MTYHVVNQKLVIEQAEANPVYRIFPPAYVLRATYSPNYGWRTWETVAEFPTREEAEEFIRKDKENQ